MTFEEELKFKTGELFKEKREDKAWSQERIGEELGQNGNNIGRVERGKNFPSFLTYYRFIKAFNLDGGDFIKELDKRLDNNEY